MCFPVKLRKHKYLHGRHLRSYWKPDAQSKVVWITILPAALTAELGSSQAHANPLSNGIVPLAWLCALHTPYRVTESILISEQHPEPDRVRPADRPVTA